MNRKPKLVGEVRDIGREGDAVVSTPKGVVFVPGALPGEEVELEVRGSYAGSRRGRLLGVRRPAPGRRSAPCVHAERCGGCPLMIAGSALQTEVKRDLLRRALEASGAPGTPVEWQGSPNSFGYRRRARLSWQGSRLGYRRRDSRRVVAIDRCVVLEEPLQRAWAHVVEWLGSHLCGSGEVLLGLGGAGLPVVELRSEDDQPPELFDACRELVERSLVAGVALRLQGVSAPAVWGDVTVVVAFPGRPPLTGSVGSFCQANDAVNQALVRVVIELAEPLGARVLELYAGIGNFTVPLALRAKSVLAVERDSAAVRACEKNLRVAGCRARVVVGDADHPPGGRFDVVVVDPPRQGAKAFFATGLTHRPKRIVYVSCDTATLSRDLRLAQEQGYRVDRAVGLDMFPQTAHVESVVRLVYQ